MMCSMMGNGIAVSAKKVVDLPENELTTAESAEQDFGPEEETDENSSKHESENLDNLAGKMAVEIPDFPLVKDYPAGIKAVDESIFKNRELFRPLNTGFKKLVENKNNIPFTYIEGLNEVPKISEDGKKIYYHNYFDNKAIYSYDLTTGIYKKLLDSANEFEIAADRYLLLTSSGYLKDYTLYDLQEGTVEDIPTTVTISKST